MDCNNPPAIVWQAPVNGVISAGPGIPMQILVIEGGWLLQINGQNFGLFLYDSQAMTAGEVRLQSFVAKRSPLVCG